MAISQVLNEVENGMEKKGFTLATFIDISSAFKKLDPVKASQAMIKRGVDKDIAMWYKDYLTDRHAHIRVKNTETTRGLTIG